MKKQLVVLGLIMFCSNLFSAGIGGKINNHRRIFLKYKQNKVHFDTLKVQKFCWEELRDVRYMLPDSMLSKFNTVELILFSGDHPALADWHKPEVNDLIEDFNGYKELLKRHGYLNDTIHFLIKNNDMSNRESKFFYSLAVRLFLTESFFKQLDTSGKVRHLNYLLYYNDESNGIQDISRYFLNFVKSCFPSFRKEMINCIIPGEDILNTRLKHEETRNLLKALIEYIEGGGDD